MSNQGASEFRAEIEMLSKLRHCHLVSLLGYCNDNKEMILVYEYMTCGTLFDHLHKDATPLTCIQRLKIAIGAGRGLDYLHTGFGTQQGVIHRDVKSSNILLDENLSAMLSDFGLSKIGPTNQSLSYVEASVKGTFGYLDPEYFYTRKLTVKTDVYAFGVLLFELLSGRLAVDDRYGEEQCSLVRWAQKCVKEKNLVQVVDPTIQGTISTKCLRGFAQIAYRCLLSVPKERPAMTEVVASLQALLELQEKFDVFPESSGIMGFTSKIHKYLLSTTKQNFDQSSTSSPTGPENNRNPCSSITDHNDQGEVPHHCEDIEARDMIMFTYSELNLATRKYYFDARSSVEVYDGWVYNTTYYPCKNNMTYNPSKNNIGFPIAVKKLPCPSPYFDLEMTKKIHHPNLVNILGYCLEGEQLFLVYASMHQNFDDLLTSGEGAQLPLATKVKIALGIARGIVFLHKIDYEVSESELDRSKIMLDENFTAKLSDYDVTKLVHGRYIPFYDYNEPGYYYPGCELVLLQSNLSGFTVVFAELLTGKQISTQTQKEIIHRFLHRSKRRPHPPINGKQSRRNKNSKEMSLNSLAKLCFESCNEVNSESKMLTILEKYDISSV